ncbi:MAG: ArsR/SmtB family transcription factor [Promethearchaeota archaeon]
MESALLTNKPTGIKTATGTLDLGSPELTKIAKALSSGTRQKILKLLKKEPMDVSRIAGYLEQTEANISAQISILNKANLVACTYKPGDHGVRKICSIAVNNLTITF